MVSIVGLLAMLCYIHIIGLNHLTFLYIFVYAIYALTISALVR